MLGDDRMTNQSGYISSGNNRLHYLKWGSGKLLLLAFHGYGNDAAIFAPLADYLKDEYTILSFDLPHHGKSEWSKDTLLTRKQLVDLVENAEKMFATDKISLIGYSMGGRVCLSVLESRPANVEKVILLATDGLSVNGYYYFFTRTWIGKGIFRNMLSKPDPYVRVADWLKNKKLVNASRHKFATHFMQSDHSRDFLLRVWPSMSELIPSPSKLKATIKQYKIPVVIFMGAYDKIMPPSLGEAFRSGLDTVQLIVLEKGHRLIDHESAQQIAEHLL
jgi:pimeloyl-ACP methyl ester carboxylesterase